MDCLPDLTCSPRSPALRAQPDKDARKKVLIVDDEYLIRYSLRELLAQQGYDAITAESGREALRLFEEQKPENVILDIHLPDSNGLALLKTFKELSPSVTVIMATGRPDMQSSAEARRMGALDYLEKPVDMEKLGALLLLHHRRP